MDLDADPDPAFKKKFFCYYFLKIHLHRFSKDKKSKRSDKKSQNSRNQGCSYYFCLIIEGSGSERPKPCGSGGFGSETLVNNMLFGIGTGTVPGNRVIPLVPFSHLIH
jgi:hypothetical protein